MKTKRDREIKQQEIHERRGELERKRHERYLHFKNTGKLDQYYLQKSGAKWILGKISTAAGPGIPILPWWKRLINWFKNLFK